MSILGLLGCLFFTCIFGVFLVTLLKIIRAVMIVGVKNKELNMETEEVVEDLEDVDDDGERSSYASKGTSDPDYWLDTNTRNAYTFPSPARLSYSLEKPIIMRANNIGVFGKNGTRIGWIWSSPEEDSNKQDNDDPKLFKLHYFDLKNFEPEDKGKPHWERAESYVVLECASGGFMYSDMVTEYPSYGLDVTFKHPAVADTNYTDDRFFSMHEHVVDDVKYFYLKHLASGYLVSAKGGAAGPFPTLKYMSGGPSEIELFLFKNTPKDNPAAPEGRKERKKE